MRFKCMLSQSDVLKNRNPRFTDICTITAFNARIEFRLFCSLFILSGIQIPDQFVYRHVGRTYPHALAAIDAGKILTGDNLASLS
jgi:hypothetical protein